MSWFAYYHGCSKCGEYDSMIKVKMKFVPGSDKYLIYPGDVACLKHKIELFPEGIDEVHSIQTMVEE